MDTFSLKSKNLLQIRLKLSLDPLPVSPRELLYWGVSISFSQAFEKNTDGLILYPLFSYLSYTRCTCISSSCLPPS